MSTEEQHVALPKLYGAPAYARPPRQVAETPRPIDPDDLPIAVHQTPEERAIAESLPARSYAPGAGSYTDATGHQGSLQLTPQARPFSIRAIAGKLLGN